MSNELRLPAVEGIQAGRVFYTVMLQYKAVAALCVSPDVGCEDLPLEYRRQRSVSSLRAAKVHRYLVEAAVTRGDYVFPSLVVTVDGKLNFKPSSTVRSIGLLAVPHKAAWNIVDGQHRVEAIKRLCRGDLGGRTLNKRERWNLEDTLENSVPVMVFTEGGYAKSQQMFVDINRNVSKPNRNLLEAFDHRRKDSESCTT